MKKAVNHFAAYQIPVSVTSDIRGGQSFCEWYLDFCDSGKDQFNSQVLWAYSYWDSMYPNGHNLSIKQLTNYTQTLKSFFGL